MLMKLRIISIFQLFAAISVLVRCTLSQDECVPDGRISPGDGIDNDCDGRIDEEYCYNGIDEDGDGLMNEDCAALTTCERRGTSSGLEFVGAFLENRPVQFFSQLGKLELIIARTPQSSQGAIAARIKTPANDRTGNISLTIWPGGISAKTFLPDLRLTGSLIAMTAFYVRADSSISVYGINKDLFSSGSFLQLPADSLGTDYYAITYGKSLFSNEIAIVGLYSNTNVSITLPAGENENYMEVRWNYRTYTNGDTFQIQLQPFQVAQIQTGNDLTGTHVTSNLPVAFYSGNVQTWIRDATELEASSRDHVVEQIPSTDTWGTRFVTQNYPPHTGDDRVFVISSQPDTTVDVTITDGSKETETSRFILLKRGSFNNQLRLKPYMRISLVASKPIMVVQFTHSQLGSPSDEVPPDEFADPSFIYIVPVDQFDTDYSFETSDFIRDNSLKNSTTFYLVLTAKEGIPRSIRLDGQPLKNYDYKPYWRGVSIRGNQSEGEESVVQYLVGYMKLEKGAHRIRAVSAELFGAVLWAVDDRNSYAHPLGIRWKKSQCQKCQQVICGDRVDNDCDGRIDEEKCDGTDTDGDGLIDEDCACSPLAKAVKFASPVLARRATSTTAKPIRTLTVCPSSPILPPNAQIVSGGSSLYIPGSSMTITCKYGFLQASEEIFCLQGGHWSEISLECVPIFQTEPSTTVEQSTVQTTPFLPRTTVQPFCFRKAPNIPHGTIISGLRAQNSLSKFGDVITYRCDPGYMFIGHAQTLTCLGNGLWSCPTPLCVNAPVTFPGANLVVITTKAVVTTPQPNLNAVRYCEDEYPKIHHGHVLSGLYDEYGASEVGHVITYRCDPGHSFLGLTNSVTCLENGQWSSPTPACSPTSSIITTQSPFARLLAGKTTPAHSYRHIVKSARNENNIYRCKTPAFTANADSVRVNKAGDTMKVECAPGYITKTESDTSFCNTTTQQWSPIIECLRTCGTAPRIPNAFINYQSFSYSRSVTGSVVRYSCARGFTREYWQGDDVICSEFGSWPEDLPRCTSILKNFT